MPVFKTITWTLVFTCICLLAVGQDGFKYQRSGIEKVVPKGTVKVSAIKDVWMPQLQLIEAPAPGGASYHDFLDEVKKGINKEGTNKQQTPFVHLGDAEDPIIPQSFIGNDRGRVPCDNDVAISNDGMLISVINSNILFYNTNTNTVLGEFGLYDFSDTLGITPNMYDPKVVYDPDADRFVMVWLSGNEADSSNIILAFSATADPMDDWNFYYLPGNALDGATWTDYPMIALTDNELILTGNALINDTFPATVNDSWKYLFKESIIWQVGLQNGYDGDTLSYRYYSGIYHNGTPIRNLCPVEGGSGTPGPFCYLLSNRNFDLTNDTIFVLKLTGVHTDVNTELQLELNFTDIPYGVPPDGLSWISGTDTIRMQTNDARILGAIYELGAIRYVQATVLTDSARSGIYHGYINVSDASNLIEGEIIGDYDMDFSYPNISYTGRYPYDTEYMISFLHTSLDTFPGISAVFFNGNEGYSNRVTVKTGEDKLGSIGNPKVRWGDYSGSAPKYNEPGTVWISGYYVKAAGGGNPRSNRTWIAKLTSPDTTVIIGVNEPVKTKPEVTAYPTPAPERVNVVFEVPVQQKVEISLYDVGGKLIKTFMHEAVEQGKHQFSISTQPLSGGMYYLKVSGENEVWETKKILKP